MSFSFILWGVIIIVLAIVLSFPRWITYFYPLPHKELVMKYSAQYDVDPYLVFAVIRTESDFQSQATSSSGARGLMQLMPETASWAAQQAGLKDYEESQLSDPNVNIRLGCWYLNDLSREFKGRLPLVIAAYNAGRGNVREWLVQGVWDGSTENLQKIPFPETRMHVQRVLNDYEVYRTIYE
ncbi:MAG: lytic transglycosylase domain-containing protein [Chitinophagales bacterium]